ncbi:MAG: toprim domain-containing protein [Ruminococcus sp.]|nr:toprim domain-containing protein [Ruminococcus sp.]
MSIPQEIIQQARNTNLVEFLIAMGIDLKRVGFSGEYQHPEHDSLFIKGHYFKWFSRDIKGNSNAITLVMELFGWDFKTAVERLTGFEVDNNITILPTEPQHRYKPSADVLSDYYNSDNKKVIAYLVNTRKLNYRYIRLLIDKGRIKQSRQHSNCCFVIRDFNGGYISDELHGTYNMNGKRFKGLSRPQNDFGFTLQQGVPERLLFFESAIDLISYIQLLSFQSCRNSLFVSLAGLKMNVALNYIRHYSDCRYILATDNDKPSKAFKRDLWSRLTAEEKERYQGTLLPKEPYKDWNEMLQNM